MAVYDQPTIEASRPGGTRAARLAVSTIFFVNGVLVSSWLTRIPSVKHDLGLSESRLGIALLCAAVGALIAMPLTGSLINRYGSRTMTYATSLLCSGAVMLPALAPNLWLLMLGLALFGAGNGAMDVSMNAQGVVVERRHDRPIMSSLHGLWSVGGLAGAAVGGPIAANGIPASYHLIGAGLAAAIIALLVMRWLIAVDAEDANAGPSFVKPTGALAVLGFIAFCVLLTEGAIADWSAVYLDESLHAGLGLAAYGYAAFSLLMAVGRLSGDWLGSRFGPVSLVRTGGGLATFGLVLALAFGEPLVAIAGFACVGAGISFIFPAVLSAAARTPSASPGSAVAAMATAGYSGFLIGPPVIGFTAELGSLRIALALVAVLTMLVVVLAPAFGGQRTAR